MSCFVRRSAVTGVALNAEHLLASFSTLQAPDLGGFETDVGGGAVVFLGFLAIIPTIEATGEIASNTAESFERNVTFIFLASTGRAAMSGMIPR